MDDEKLTFDAELDGSADEATESILSSLINFPGELECEEPGFDEDAVAHTGGHSPHSREADYLLEAALAYHELGLPITLCQPEKKKPIVKDWPNYKWTPDEIRRAFDKFGTLNVGLVLGPRSDLIDIECDGPKGDQELLALFEGDVPVTPTWYSARGAHRLFRWQEELRQCGKSVVHLGDLELRLGVDGRGAQSLLPPSITDSWGRKWAVGLDECDVASLPAAVLAKLLDRFGRHVLASEVEKKDGHSIGHSIAVSHAVSNLPQPDIVPSKPAVHSKADHSPKPLSAAIKRAIDCTLPGAPGFRNKLLLQFARHLRAIPELADCELATLEPYVRQWHAQALSVIETQDFDETWHDFVIAWENVKYPVGQGPLDEIFAAGLKQMPDSARRYKHPKMRELVAFCQELQRRSDPYPFWLSCRAAASVLNIGRQTANNGLLKLQHDGILERVHAGSRGRAAEYFYLGTNQVVPDE